MSRGPVVVDTNVLVSGLLTPDSAAPTARIVDLMLDGGLWYLLSEALLAEYRAVLLRPRIVAVHGLAPDEVDEILVRIATYGAVREVSVRSSRQDAHLFALLDAEPEAVLVSGDAAALRRARDRGLSPRSLVDSLGKR